MFYWDFPALQPRWARRTGIGMGNGELEDVKKGADGRFFLPVQRRRELTLDRKLNGSGGDSLWIGHK